MFFLVTAYRQMGDSYRRLYASYVFAYNIDSTDIFGCAEENVTDEEWILSSGDRIGVYVQQSDCVQSVSPTNYANMIDPS